MHRPSFAQVLRANVLPPGCTYTPCHVVSCRAMTLSSRHDRHVIIQCTQGGRRHWCARLRSRTPRSGSRGSLGCCTLRYRAHAHAAFYYRTLIVMSQAHAQARKCTRYIVHALRGRSGCGRAGRVRGVRADAGSYSWCRAGIPAGGCWAEKTSRMPGCATWRLATPYALRTHATPCHKHTHTRTRATWCTTWRIATPYMRVVGR